MHVSYAVFMKFISTWKAKLSLCIQWNHIRERRSSSTHS
jgi:hypothetical protein